MMGRNTESQTSQNRKDDPSEDNDVESSQGQAQTIQADLKFVANVDIGENCYISPIYVKCSFVGQQLNLESPLLEFEITDGHNSVYVGNEVQPLTQQMNIPLNPLGATEYGGELQVPASKKDAIPDTFVRLDSQQDHEPCMAPFCPSCTPESSRSVEFQVREMSDLPAGFIETGNFEDTITMYMSGQPPPSVGVLAER